MRIAFLEDDPAQADLVRSWLLKAGHQCSHELDGEAFIRTIRSDSFDLFVIDWLLPGISGLEVLQWIRANIDWQIPVIFTTSRASEQDIVTALEAGADDYLVKPIKHEELLARINAISRRNQRSHNQRLEFGEYHIDLESNQIKKDDQEIGLTPREFQLGVFLFRNAGRLISKNHIMESVWGTCSGLNTRTVDTHISRVRQKLALGPNSGWRLVTIYQHGYRLEKTNT